jgi:hypothetical protein
VNELGQYRHGKPKGGMDGAINGPHHHTFGAQAPAELGSDAVAEVAAVAWWRDEAVGEMWVDVGWVHLILSVGVVLPPEQKRTRATKKMPGRKKVKPAVAAVVDAGAFSWARIETGVPQSSAVTFNLVGKWLAEGALGIFPLPGELFHPRESDSDLLRVSVWNAVL